MDRQLERLLLDLKAGRVSRDAVKEQLKNHREPAGPGASAAPGDGPAPAPELVRARPVWRPAVPGTGAGVEGHLVLLAGPAELDRALRERAGQAAVRLLVSSADRLAERYADLAVQVLEALRELAADRSLPRTVVQLVVPAVGADALLAGLFGLLKSAALENPRLLPQLVLVEPSQGADAAAGIVACAGRPGEREVRLRADGREVRGWEELPEPGPTALPWKEGGVYVVTGGLGGLGLLLARDLVGSVSSVTVHLVGRSALDDRRRAVLEALARPGARLSYTALDVADAARTEAFLAAVRRESGTIDGVLHSAGVLRDDFVLRKSAGQLREVFAPKVAGTVNLDRATRDDALDFFALFSSLAAVTGNVGQADYAAANAFQDAFAHHRDGLAAAGRRSGRSLSVNWPLWAEGGMAPDPETVRALRAEVGMDPLATASGLRVLHEALASAHCQVMAVEGDGPRIRRTLLGDGAQAATAADPVAPAASTEAAAAPEVAEVAEVDEGVLHERVVRRLKQVLGGVIGLPTAKIDPQAPLEDYGIDSIVITRLNRKFAEVFTGLSKTVLYEFNVLDELAGHLLREHRGTCLAWTGLTAARAPRTAPAVAVEAPGTAARPVPAQATPVAQPAQAVAVTATTTTTTNTTTTATATATASVRPADDAVAIIGMSGRFPQARTLDEFWRNLAEGRDSVTAIPADRWSLEGFYHHDRDEAVARGLSYSKWGGFLDGFAEFDPLFFGISPHEAMNTDPQERLFLQESWNALEDAGYTRRRLAQAHGGRVGVFAGVSKTGFDLHGPGLWERDGKLHPLTSFASVANRVSYVLDLHGPSLPVDTMCSSSLSAVHEAIEHLRRGECDLALAGGVNLYLHPSNYTLMSGKRMLSDDGRCRSFGAGGNGFVPGEGVAVVLLKRLADAERDGDTIHAVLRGSSINHGGRTNGYTVPNPVAQAEVVRAALDRAGVSARDISYLEAHGTGTELGDPIEVDGLTQAFAPDSGDRQYCALGSAKSNIGHLEAAAGIAGLLKVVLQMRHGRLVPSLHADELNPNIDFGRTPFRLQREAGEWRRPVAADGTELPRLAGVSSFGAGGSNAHVVVEEYRPAAAARTAAPPADPSTPRPIVLSARDEERLRERALDLLDWLDRQDLDALDLDALARTLQTGREAMETRLGLLAATPAELLDRLGDFLAGAQDVEDLYLGNVKEHRETLAVLAADADMAATVDRWIAKGKYDKVLDLWTKGLAVDWDRFHPGGRPRMLSLPGYPFARERHWVGDLAAGPAAAPRPAGLHPLLHANTSSLDEQRFASEFTGGEFFLADHVVHGRKVLPGAAYLELARAAVSASLDAVPERISLRNVVWARPLTVDGQPARVRTTLFAEEDGAVAFEITGLPDGDRSAPVVHSQGLAVVGAAVPAEPLDVAALRAACGTATLDADQCYRAYAAMGLDYGPGHRGLAGIEIGDGQAVARLLLPEAVAAGLDSFVLHPGLLDSALQSSLGLFGAPGADGPAPLHLPFALDELEILGPCTPAMWAWARYSADDRPDGAVRKLDIDLLDDAGAPRARLRGFTSRAYTADAGQEAPAGREPVEAAQPLPAAPAAAPAAPARPVGTLAERTAGYLVGLLAAELRLPAERIEADDDLSLYGLDSIMTMNLTNSLERVFGSLPKTLFFEYQTIRALAEYFVAGHEGKLAALLGAGDAPAAGAPVPPAAGEAPAHRSEHRSGRRSARRDRARRAGAGPVPGSADIAVIGLAGRYPQARNVREFWRNLAEGRDSITEVPADRWDHGRYFDPDPDAPGRTYTKWGGFLDRADHFDPLFFNISPREAAFMDPQERLFLECVHETLEDAGYPREALSRHDGRGLPGNVGVFVGVMYQEYQLYGAQEQARGRNVTLSGSASSIANRISYVFDLHGPSLAVDTMCSSSLTALHLACESLRTGGCELAVAGGVNLSLHPNKYLMLGHGKYASSKGRCESFGEGGDGYVPGEGVGAVLLKPLDRAVADGDTVYGVIRGTAVNHGGRTNGYSVPNPRAQHNVVGHALRAAGVDARSVSYVEAHGTGTSLGDPIEIAGLTRAFGEHTGDRQFCAIGSVKSNIGHAESAAGIAALTKVLLQLKHGTLVPSLHSEVLNPHIDFADTPFRVQRELAEWRRPVAADGTELPRLAGISSFGAGGSNAHVIVEEYVPATAARPAGDADDTTAVVLSARTAQALRAQAEQLRDWLAQDGAAVALTDLAHTLRVGREAYEERLGLVVGSTAELAAKLGAFLAGAEPAGWYRGRADRQQGAPAGATGAGPERAGAEQAGAADARPADRDLDRLLERWVTGRAVDWERLSGADGARRVPLPTYPFQGERYWLAPGPATAPQPADGAGRLHPLLHTNTSSLHEQRFTSVYTGEEFFLRDHRVRGERVLSGAACLELARAAVAASLDGPSGALRVRNVVWARPVTVGERPRTVRVALLPKGPAEVGFEIFSAADGAEDGTGDRVIHGEGSVVVDDAPAPAARLDLAALRAACRGPEVDAEQAYRTFRAHGIDYGPGHRGVERILTGDGQVLAELALPGAVRDTLDAYVLHPALLDSALQACAGMPPLDGGEGRLLLPFALDELEILGPCTPAMWAWVREGARTPDGAVRRLDIDLCDEQGGVRVRLRGVSLRAFPVEPAVRPLVAVPLWSAAERADGGEAPEGLVLVAGLPRLAIALEARGAGRVVRLESAAAGVDGRYTEDALTVLRTVRELLGERAQHPVRVQLVAPADAEGALWAGLFAVLQSAHLENPRVLGQLVLVDPQDAPEDTAEQVLADRAALSDTAVRYRGGARELLRWSEPQDAPVAPAPWRDGGVYLITGGAGGLGALFARDIAERTSGARIVLTGRAPLDGRKEELLRELRESGAEARYEPADVADRAAVEALVGRTVERFGRIDGVLHAAGFLKDGFVLRKSEEDFASVLAPKVAGLVNLDRATRALDLGFLAVFSSVAGALGNVGQSDYAAANAFMDAYALHRNALVAAGERSGRTVAFDWPLWADGGMHVDPGTERSLAERFGLVPLRTTTGLQAFDRALSADWSRVLVLEGDRPRLRETLLAGLLHERTAPASAPVPAARALPAPAQALPMADGTDEDTAQRAAAYFKKLLASVIDLPAARIDALAPLEDYGVDSVMTMELTRALEQVFGSLPKTLFFEFRTIDALSRHFLETRRERMSELVAVSAPARAAAVATAEPERAPARTWRTTAQARSAADRPGGQGPAPTGDIAIIGLAGRYPKARDVEAFWHNLATGTDCVTEVPADRWDHGRWFDAAPAEGRTYSKWGGFLDGAYDFDPQFFGISPREAEIMDPQERLFLQCVHETLEDAGYVRDTGRSATGHVLAGRVGVFAGVMYEEYQLFGAQSQLGGAPLAVAGSPASIANRVSYYFDLRGPSLSLDTMCSSSLTALHLACQSLRAGDCETAIAGGVNLSLHPNKYLLLSQGRFASTDGRCRSFGEGGDGYVPGEGVGAVLLKPLARALADGDRIHGVIKGTAVNHGGKTNGYSVPNPQAQTDVVARALASAGVDARTVSYVEAHGTGTALGDPIEVAGLVEAFGAHTGDRQFCAIGSVKSNIGHAESAAGIAGLTKVLLQLRHGKLAPSLHADALNPHIDFGATPFVVQRELADWPVATDASGARLPRVAGISSFGAGGSNAHVVVAEHLPARPPRPAPAAGRPTVVPLSARTADRLRERAADLVAWLERPEHAGLDLADVAHTLQVGREAMAERLAVTADSVADLLAKLRRFLDGGAAEDVVRGRADRDGTVLSLFAPDTDLDAMIAAWAVKGKHEKLVDLWVNGVPVDWRLLPGADAPRRIALPAYPFARERYFPFDGEPGPAPAAAGARLHPLIHTNTSDFEEQRYTSVFTGQEFFLRDHVVHGERMLPGAAALEMAVAAACLSSRTTVEPSAPVALRNVVLGRPLTVAGRPEEVHVGLRPEADGDIRFRIHGAPEEVHAEGTLYFVEGLEEGVLDLAALRAACDRPELTAERCYELYRAAGIGYGPAHRSVRRILVGRGQALAELALPGAVAGTTGEFTLHPSLVDGALQACVGVLEDLGRGAGAEGGLAVPFAVDDVLVLGPCTEAMWAWVRPSSEQSGDGTVRRLDVDLADELGRIRVRIGGLSFRVIENTENHVPVPVSNMTDDHVTSHHVTRRDRTVRREGASGGAATLLVPRIEAREARRGPSPVDGVRRIVLLAGLPDGASALLEDGGGTEVAVLTSGEDSLDGRYTAYALQLLERLRTEAPGSAGKVHVQLAVAGGPGAGPLVGLAAMLRTANLENPNITGQLVLLDPADTAETAVGRILDNRTEPEDTVVRYRDGRREVWTWTAQDTADDTAVAAPSPWKERGVYLITGGTGALGLVLAREIAERTGGATLVLTGRSAEDADKRAALADLVARGAGAAHYERADLASREETDALIARTLHRYGRIDGVIHSAGVTRDALILRKRAEDFRAVLAPKVAGLVNLDTATRDLPLDFLVTFSSTSGAHGNVGQVDYAAANAFMDAYAWHRRDLVARGERSGHSQSIGWPLWADGGMRVPAGTAALLRERYGVVPLETAEGLAAFYRALGSPHSQVLVTAGAAGHDGAGTATATDSATDSATPHENLPVTSAAGTNS